MGGVVITKDDRFVKILEVLPVNIYLKSPNDRQNIIASFAAYLKIAPNDLQMVARTLPADTQAYVEQMRRCAEQEDNAACREMIEDNIQEIGYGIASDAMRHRFFLVFQYEAGMRAKHNTVRSIIQRLNEEADTARRYLDACEVEVLEPRYLDLGPVERLRHRASPSPYSRRPSGGRHPSLFWLAGAGKNIMPGGYEYGKKKDHPGRGDA